MKVKDNMANHNMKTAKKFESQPRHQRRYGKSTRIHKILTSPCGTPEKETNSRPYTIDEKECSMGCPKITKPAIFKFDAFVTIWKHFICQKVIKHHFLIERWPEVYN